MTNVEQLRKLDDLEVDFAGMIFYNQSERFVQHKLKGEEVKRQKLKLKKVGVFVNEPEENIFRNAELFGLDLVQLHGDETPAYCKSISERLTVIKAFRIHKDNEQNIDWMIKPYEDHCDYYLFDTNGKGAYGGTGKKFDWNILQGNKINKPFFLSGGIEPGDDRWQHCKM